MLPRFICATDKNKEKASILVFVVGMLIVVLVLAMAMIMLSSSQYFLSHAQKENLAAFYLADAQVQWAAMKLKSNPGYRGGTSAPDIYVPPADEGQKDQVELTKIVVTGPVNVGQLDEAEWRIKTYVRFKESFGKRKTAARIDAKLVKTVVVGATGTTITYTIKDWQEIRPPEEP